jgi:hypothetical protein
MRSRFRGETISGRERGFSDHLLDIFYLISLAFVTKSEQNNQVRARRTDG